MFSFISIILIALTILMLREDSCEHDYKTVASLSYYINGNKHYCTLFECIKCGDKKAEYTSLPHPMPMAYIIGKWKLNEYTLDNLIDIFGGNKNES